MAEPTIWAVLEDRFRSLRDEPLLNLEKAADKAWYAAEDDALRELLERVLQSVSTLKKERGLR